MTAAPGPSAAQGPGPAPAGPAPSPAGPAAPSSPSAAPPAPAPSRRELIAWMLRVTRPVLAPLLGSTLARIADLLAGVGVFVNHHRNDIYLQLLGEVECSAMKAEDRAIGRSCAFGEDHDGITAVYGVAQTVDHLFDTARDGIKVGISDQSSVKRRVPHPIVRQNNEFGREHHDTHQIKV